MVVQVPLHQAVLPFFDRRASLMTTENHLPLQLTSRRSDSKWFHHTYPSASPEILPFTFRVSPIFISRLKISNFSCHEGEPCCWRRCPSQENIYCSQQGFLSWTKALRAGGLARASQ